ncbi:MAG TPA: cyclic nucleotide-binding domain-containing protein [Candidatus Sulfotelmatobacter sp.]|nr:cyclic nucleotide-binding domain-containing protein [Candidatus Sulfotelmatobacter sp.]
MRIESSVTSISWIPSGAVEGVTKLPFEAGVGHYDPPPPDELHDLGQLIREDRCRFANELRGWIDVEDGKITAFGYGGGGRIGQTRVRLGVKDLSFAAVPFEDLRSQPELREDSVRFVQTAGGRTGVPAPRRVRRPPFVQVAAPTAWSTLALTVRADGASSWELLGASPFPRHWIYDSTGHVVGKTGLVDFDAWYREAFGDNTPWGGTDSPALVAQAVSVLEQRISNEVMRGGEKPRTHRLREGEVLVTQGEPGLELFVLLDGVLSVEVNGNIVAEVGPGAILGERALLEGGRRTATLKAVTRVHVAVVDGASVDKEALAGVAAGHRREELADRNGGSAAE